MIDYHCHILPGLDDGAATVAEAMAMARLLVAAGITEVYCTPHCIRGVYDNTPAIVRTETAELQQRLDRAGLPLRLHPGMEYYLDEFFPEYLEHVQPLGETGMVLVEAPARGRWETVLDGVSRVVQRGLVPLVAHPERYAWLVPEAKNQGGLAVRLKGFLGLSPSRASATDPAPLAVLQQQGARFQGNLGAFAGYYGGQVRERAEYLRKADIYRFFGSDAHDPDRLPMILKGLEGAGTALAAGG